MKKVVVLGITGGIAAYKSLELVKLLRKENVDVFVVMTKNAAKIINPFEFEKISGHKVYLELFEKDFDYKKVLQTRKVDYIDLAGKASLLIIAPATADTIAKVAHGFADDYLTAVVLAASCPIIICPSMNVNMWNNPIVQENISKLKAREYQIIKPEIGMLACGYKGQGRLADVRIIKDEALKQLNRSFSLRGKKIIVTAGGTIEKIDEVRFIANRSSGKMGIAIAEECYTKGADVLLLRSKNSVKPRYLIKEEVFTTAEDLLRLIKTNIKDASFFYHVAAVSDFQLEKQFKGKIKSEKDQIIKLKPREKILDQIKRLNPCIFLVAFKAEYGLNEEELVKSAKKKLKESKADVIIANDVSRNDRGFEADNNEVIIVSSDHKPKKVPCLPKRDIAKDIVDYVNHF